MNNSIIEILKILKYEYNLLALKAEFEAEGISLDELALFADLANTVDVELTLKIGGPNALRDMHEAWQVGASNILVPMIESEAALNRSLQLYHKCSDIYSKSSGIGPKFSINIETKTAVSISRSIASIAQKNLPILSGIVIGRKDLASSLGIFDVNDNAVSEQSLSAINCFNSESFDITIGGGVTPDSYFSLKNYFSHKISACETRKCTLKWSPETTQDHFSRSVQLSLRFEQLWLEHKINNQTNLQRSDMARIDQLKKRLNG